MSFNSYEDNPPSLTTSRFNNPIQRRSHDFPNGVVFSANNSFNPSSVAIKESIQQLFDPFADMISNELRYISRNSQSML